MNFPYFISNMLYGVFHFVRKCLHFIVKYVIVLFVCLSLYLRCFSKNLQFYQLSYVILNFMIHMLDKNFSSTRKYLHFPFQLCDNSIWMPIIISDSFQENLKFYQLYYIILNFIMNILDEHLQFYQKISPLPFSIVF